jgi:hypothetical protein
VPSAIRHDSGGPSADGNYAKIGVSLEGSHAYMRFSDMNQQGALSGVAKKIWQQPKRTRRALLCH